MSAVTFFLTRTICSCRPAEQGSSDPVRTAGVHRRRGRERTQYESGDELAARLFENARVSGLAGSVFGKRGEGHIRFVFNAPVAEISEGVERLQNYLRKL